MTLDLQRLRALMARLQTFKGCLFVYESPLLDEMSRARPDDKELLDGAKADLEALIHAAERAERLETLLREIAESRALLPDEFWPRIDAALADTEKA